MILKGAKLKSSGGSSNYIGQSPTNITVGGLPSGTSLTGRSISSILEEMLIDYLVPAFTSFNINGQSQTIEVQSNGLTGNKTFNWNISNPSNVQTNSISLVHINSSTNIATGLANDSVEIVDITSLAIDTTVQSTQSFRADAINTQATPFSSSLFSINVIHPIFYGKSVGIPTVNQTLIDGGTKQVVSSTGTVTINFGATNEYIWFAIPNTSADKTKWYVDTINNGNIGSGSDLFANEVIFNADSPTLLWSNVDYKVYISNFPTSTTGNMELRNS